MMFCLTGASYSMTMDIAQETISQNADTGQVDRSWSISQTYVACSARGLGNLRGKQSGTAQEWSNVFKDYDYLRIKTTQKISQSDRIVNVRGSDGEIIWTESDGTPTIFEVIGVSPSLDPFGSVWEYEIFANRAAVQEAIS